MVFRILVLSLESFVLYCSKMSFPPIERKIVVFLNSFTELEKDINDSGILSICKYTLLIVALFCAKQVVFP